MKVWWPLQNVLFFFFFYKCLVITMNSSPFSPSFYSVTPVCAPALHLDIFPLPFSPPAPISKGHLTLDKLWLWFRKNELAPLQMTIKWHRLLVFRCKWKLSRQKCRQFRESRKEQTGCFNDLPYHAGTCLFTHKQKAVRLVYQLNRSDRCVYNPPTLPAFDHFNIHTCVLIWKEKKKSHAPEDEYIINTGGILTWEKS